MCNYVKYKSSVKSKELRLYTQVVEYLSIACGSIKQFKLRMLCSADGEKKNKLERSKRKKSDIRGLRKRTPYLSLFVMSSGY
jgi:hypothetical protein